MTKKDGKIQPVEIESMRNMSHTSMDVFCRKYFSKVGERFLFSQKDRAQDGTLQLLPIYLMPFVL